MATDECRFVSLGVGRITRVLIQIRVDGHGTEERAVVDKLVLHIFHILVDNGLVVPDLCLELYDTLDTCGVDVDTVNIGNTLGRNC